MEDSGKTAVNRRLLVLAVATLATLAACSSDPTPPKHLSADDTDFCVQVITAATPDDGIPYLRAKLAELQDDNHWETDEAPAAFSEAALMPAYHSLRSRNIQEPDLDNLRDYAVTELWNLHLELDIPGVSVDGDTLWAAVRSLNDLAEYCGGEQL